MGPFDNQIARRPPVIGFPPLPGFSPQRPHSVGPFIPPWLAPFGTGPLDLQQRALAQILPYFPVRPFASPYDYNNIINPWIRTHPEVGANVWNALHPDGLRRAFHFVLNAAAVPGGLNFAEDVRQRILDEVEDAWRIDKQYGVRQSSLAVSRDGQHRFRSLAEISNACRSTFLGQLLRDFFLEHVRYIATNDSPRSLAQWCFAIIRATMRSEDKDRCLTRLVSYRPGIIDELRYETGPRATRVREKLIDLAGGSGQLVVLPRSPSLGLLAQYINDPNDPFNNFILDPLELDEIEQCENKANFHISEARREEAKARRIGTGTMRGRARSDLDDPSRYDHGSRLGRLRQRPLSTSPGRSYGGRLYTRPRSPSFSRGWPWPDPSRY